MKCKHTHKDAPENSVCEDCHREIISYLKMRKEFEMTKEKEEIMVCEDCYREMKGGLNKNEKEI